MTSFTVGCAIFARMSSTRLPGKALMSLSNGKTILESVIEACASVVGYDNCYVATSTDVSDDPLAQWAERYTHVYRGDLENVFSRFSGLLEVFAPRYCFRITGDSPFIHRDLLRAAIRSVHSDSTLDLVTNVCERSWPIGMSFDLLRSSLIVDRKFGEPTSYDKEHVTSYLHRNINDLKYINVECPWGNLNSTTLAIDTANDLRCANRFIALTRGDMGLQDVCSKAWLPC